VSLFFLKEGEERRKDLIDLLEKEGRERRKINKTYITLGLSIILPERKNEDTFSREEEESQIG